MEQKRRQEGEKAKKGDQIHTRLHSMVFWHEGAESASLLRGKSFSKKKVGPFSPVGMAT